MENEQISFEIISKAGEAFSILVKALEHARNGKLELAEESIKNSEKLMNEAHNIQTNLIVKEANGVPNEFSVLLIHAQDTLMNTILMSTIVKEMILMFNTLKKELTCNEQ